MNTPNERILFASWCLLLIVTLQLTSIACNHDPEITINDPEIINTDITGDWEWFKYINSNPYGVGTPESTGLTMSLTFTPLDSVRYYSNGGLTHTKAYRFEYKKDGVLGEPLDSTLVLKVEDRPFYYFSISNDTLLLSHSYMDIGAWFYKRVH